MLQSRFLWLTFLLLILCFPDRVQCQIFQEDIVDTVEILPTRTYSIFTTIGLFEFLAVGIQYQVSDFLGVHVRKNYVVGGGDYSLSSYPVLSGYGLGISVYVSSRGSIETLYLNGVTLTATYLTTEDQNELYWEGSGGSFEAMISHESTSGRDMGFSAGVGVGRSWFSNRPNTTSVSIKIGLHVNR